MRAGVLVCVRDSTSSGAVALLLQSYFLSSDRCQHTNTDLMNDITPLAYLKNKVLEHTRKASSCFKEV